MSMSSSEYSQYRAAIEAANDSQDREALRQIQKQLIAKYGADDRDVYYLLKMFRYNVKKGPRVGALSFAYSFSLFWARSLSMPSSV